jgi:endonuclease I/V8-like Glu-specific endopeptidase
MIDLEQIRAAEERYAQRDRSGESPAKSAERTAKRIARVTAAEAFVAGGPTAALVETPPSDSAETGRVALERLLGRNDLMSILYLERGVIAARTVCRITIRSSSTSTAAGFGTGSLVSPRLLLTNNHVLRSGEIARFSVAEFDFQETLASSAPQSRFFQLDPDAFFLTSPALDFTLVAVRDPEQVLQPYGWNQLVAEEGKVRKGEPVTIIQHPRAETKQIALRENEITDILENFLLYRTDTAPGSSGSPVFNDQWELVGLHHAGVPRKKNGQILTRTGQPWNDTMDEDLIDWIANEGARISRIIRHLKDATLSTEQAKLRAQCFEAELPRSEGGARRMPEQRAAGADGPVVQAGVATWTFPIQVSVRIGDWNSGAPPTGPGPQPPATPATSPAKPAPDEPDSDELRQALDASREAQARPYYDSAADNALREAFYENFELPGDGGHAFDALHDLLTRKHATKPKYKPAVEVYPWVDLHPNKKIRSIYSGQQFEAEELIREDFRLETIMESMRKSGETEESLSALEAALPFNCEHVVPQSWFEKKEPMRGDLHHLFACESGCNSFRGNTSYFDFAEEEEALRDKCGRSEKNQNKFEPEEGKGPVARATLYFLVRYPALINRPNEYDEERIAILKRWHRDSPPDKYEKHRNWAVNERQGNRNPFIDHPDWVDQVDFAKGLG